MFFPRVRWPRRIVRRYPAYPMKTTQILVFAVPFGVIAAGFSIGGRDGAIFSIVGCVALLIVSFWQAIKVLNQDANRSK